MCKQIAENTLSSILVKFSVDVDEDEHSDFEGDPVSLESETEVDELCASIDSAGAEVFGAYSVPSSGVRVLDRSDLSKWSIVKTEP